MPKAAIHKHRELRRAENKIGFAWQARSAPPARDAMLANQRDEAQFGRAVPA